MIFSKEDQPSVNKEVQNNNSETSRMYLNLIGNLPSVNLASDDEHPVFPVEDINWDWVAENNKNTSKEELMQKYIDEGQPFEYSIYVNTFRPCEQCNENIGSRPIVYIISLKENLLFRTSGEKLHNIEKHGDSFSKEETELLKKIFGK